MCWVHKFAVSLLLFPLIIYGLVVLVTMTACCEMRRVLKKVAMIVPKEGPVVRDKFDAMTFTQWWTDKRRSSRNKKKIRFNLKHCIRSKRKKGRRIGTMNAMCDFRISDLHAASKYLSSEHDKEDRSRMQKIRFDTDSFPLSVDTYSSRCMTNNTDHFETYVPNNCSNKGRIKLADSSSMEIKDRGMVS